MRMSESCFKEFTGVYDNKSRNERRFKDRKVLYIVKKGRSSNYCPTFFGVFSYFSHIFSHFVYCSKILLCIDPALFRYGRIAKRFSNHCRVYYRKLDFSRQIDTTVPTCTIHSSRYATVLERPVIETELIIGLPPSPIPSPLPG